MFTFLHAADLHLDSPLRGLAQYEGAPVEQIRGATRRAVENLVRLAIDRRVAFVLLAGDIYDGDWPDYGTGLFFLDQMRRLREAAIPVFLISGNHDAANKMTRQLRPRSRDLVQTLSVEEPETRMLDEWSVAIHGQGYARQETLENLAAKYPLGRGGTFNIGLLHTALGGCEGHAPYAPCSYGDLESRRYQYWALGHIHQRNDAARLGDGTPVIFPGNTQGRHIKETGEKGCVLVEVDNRLQVARTEFVPLDVFRWAVCPLDAATAANRDDLLAQAGDRFRQLLKDHAGLPLGVRVTVTGRCSPEIAALAADDENLLNELRVEANEQGGGRIWLEQLVWKATPETLLADAEGPLAELAGVLAELEQNEDALAAFGGRLKELVAKLPAEVREPALGDAPRLDSPECLREVLRESRPLLVSLLEGGGMG